MKKLFTLLIAFMLSLGWAHAQLGDLFYEQNSTIDVANPYTSTVGSTNVISADDFLIQFGESMEIGQVTATFVSNTHTNFQVKFLNYNSWMGTMDEIITYSSLSSILNDADGTDGYTYIIDFPEILSLVGDSPMGPKTVYLSVAPLDDNGQWVSLSDPNGWGYNGKAQVNTGGTWSPDYGHINGDLAFSVRGPKPLDNDMLVEALFNPTDGDLTAAEDVTISILNKGLQTQNAYSVFYQVSKTVDGSLQEVFTSSTESLTNALATAETLEFTFPETVNLSEMTVYSFEAAVILAGDEDITNNKIYAIVENIGPNVMMGQVKDTVTCDIKFYDDGGPNGNYSVVSRDTITFYSNNDGDRVSLNFNDFDKGYGEMTAMYIYDGESTDDQLIATITSLPTEPIVARNALGALTVFADVNSGLSGITNYRGWDIDVSCVTPYETEFELLEAYHLAEYPLHQMGDSNQFECVVVNKGSLTVSRNVFVRENDVNIDTLVTNELTPGGIDTLTYYYSPSLSADSVNFKFVIEDDAQDTNDDNVFETYFEVYAANTLLESFEYEDLEFPWNWTSKEGVAFVKQYSAAHANYYLNVKGANDTVVTPMLKAVEGDKLRFNAQTDGDAILSLCYSSNINGPWTELQTIDFEGTTYNWVPFEVSLDALTDTICYIGFAVTSPGKYDYIYLDFVRGPELYRFDNDLKATSIDFNTFTTSNKESVIKVGIKNAGINDIYGGDYTIELVDTSGAVLTTRNGIDIAANIEKNIGITYTFTEPDTTLIYANIVHNNELRVDNNTTNAKEIRIQSDSVYIIEMTGDEGSMDYDDPIAVKKYSSISEIIYYPSEVQKVGKLNGIGLTYSITEDNLSIPLDIYVGTTTDSVLWVNNAAKYFKADTLNIQQVFSSTVDFITGENQDLFIEFDETFNYDGTENLIVIFDRNYNGSIGTQSAKFATIDNTTGVYRSTNVSVGTYDSPVQDIDVNNPHKLPTWYNTDIYKTSFSFINTEAPAFVSTPVTMAGEGLKYTYDVEVSGGMYDLTVEGRELPEWLTLEQVDGTTATLSGTPDSVFQYNVRLAVSDGFYPATQTFVVDVKPVPEFASQPDTVVALNDDFVYNVEIAYKGEDTVAIAAKTKPDWLTLTDNGDNTATLSGTASTEDVFDVVLTATGEFYTMDQAFKVYVGNYPEIVSVLDTLIVNNALYQDPIEVSYSGEGFVEIEVETAPEWLTLTDNGDNTGLLSGTPTKIGKYPVKFTAHGDLYSTTKSYDLYVDAFPEITSKAVTQVLLEEVYTYNITATYASDSNLIITADGVPSWLTFTDNGDNTATLTGTAPDSAGVYTVNVLASGAYATDEQVFDIYVSSLYVNAVSDTVIEKGATYTRTFETTYRGDETLTLMQGVDFAAWATFTDNGDGTANLTGTANEVGDYNFTVIASDGTVKDSIVHKVAVDVVPEFTSEAVTSAIENQTYSYNVVVSYEGAQAVVIEATEKADWLTLTDNGDGTATLTGTAPESGSSDVVLTAKGAHYEATQEFTIDITVGISEWAMANIKFYPNPADYEVYITNAQNTDITIYDIAGKAHAVYTISTNKQRIDLSKLESGVYLVKINHNDYIISKTIVVE